MDYYSMSYEVMREGAALVQGRYIAWANAADDPETEQYWLGKAFQVAKDVQQIDPYDEAAIATKRAELKELFHSLPVEAPAVVA